MKKVLIFSLAYYPKHIGGAEVAIREITDRISPGEMEFHLICNRYDSSLPRVERIGNVTVHRIGITVAHPTMAHLRQWPLHINKLLFQFSAFWKAWMLHTEYHFDATWAMMAHATGVPAALFKIVFPKVTYILTLQEGDPPEYIERKMRWFGPLFRYAFTKADQIQAISTFLAQWARHMGAHCPIEVVPNAVDVERFSQHISSTDVVAIRKEFGVRSEDVVLITTSRLVHKNAIDDVIRALTHLPEFVRFVVFGTGPDDVMLKNLAVACGVDGRVDFRGQAEHADLPRYLAASNIFIRPSRSEGMGNSFIEAMATRIPVIATQEGGIADFLFDEKRNPDMGATGWAVDANNPKQIAEAVQDIITHPEKVREITARAHKLVSTHYDWDIIVKSMRQRVFASINESTHENNTHD